MLFWDVKINISQYAQIALNLSLNLKGIARLPIARLTTIMAAKDANVGTIWLRREDVWRWKKDAFGIRREGALTAILLSLWRDQCAWYQGVRSC